MDDEDENEGDFDYSEGLLQIDSYSELAMTSILL